MEENKPDVFGGQTKTEQPKPAEKKMPDFEAIYDVNNELMSEQDRAQARELAETAKKQYLEREAKFRPPAEVEVVTPSSNEAIVDTKEESEMTVVTTKKPKEPRYTIEKDYDAPFDLVELPSRGKIGPYKKDRLKVAYLTAADEDILTSYGIVESGEFFDYLFERKILDNVSYKDLHVGDRNALMIWLRATGYGNIYPVTLNDPANGEDFQHDFDLSELKVKYLGLETNENGNFEFMLPTSKKNAEFRFLSVGDIEEIEEQMEEAAEKGVKINKLITSTLKRQIISIDGVTDKKALASMIDKMPIMDSRAFRKFYEENESGIDLSISVETPGGASLSSFLPIGLTFFWPEL